MRERFHVLNQSGVTVRAFVRGPGRHKRGLACTAVDQADQGGLLARHVPAANPHHLDRQPVQPSAITRGDRAGEDPVHPVAALVQAQVGAGGPDGFRGERDPVQHQMRCPRQEHPVLHAGRLGFGAVSDHDGTDLAAQRAGPAASLSHRAHLAPGREARAAPARQPSLLDRGDQGGPVRSGRSVGERHRAVPLEMLSERERPVRRDQPRQPVRRDGLPS